MDKLDPSDNQAALTRDFPTLVDAILLRGPQAVADSIAVRERDGTDPHSPVGHLRWLLLSHAHLLVRSHDRSEVACVLHDLLARRPSVSGWLAGAERALPPVRLTVRGPASAPDDLRLVRVLTGHRAPVRSIEWSPDGERLATVGSHDTSVLIWNPRDWTQERRIGIEGAALDVALWSPDGRRLAVLGRSDRFPDLGEHRENDRSGREGRVEHVHTVLVYNTVTWEEIAATHTAPRSGFSGRPVIAWSPDSRTLAVGEDIGVRLWTVDEEERSPWLLPGGRVRQVLDLDWIPDGALTALTQGREQVPGGASTMPESLLVTWPDPGAAPEYSVWARGVPWDPITGVRRRPGSDRVCVYSRSGVALCDTAAERVLWQEERAPDDAWTKAVEWAPDGRVLAELRSRHQGWSDLVLWETGEGSEPSVVARIECAPEETTALAWSPDGDLVATGGDSGVRLWRPEPGTSHRSGFDTRVSTPVWSPDGDALAVYSPSVGEWSVVDARDPSEPVLSGPECPFPRLDPAAQEELIEAARHEGRDFDLYTSMYGPYAPDAISPGQELYALAGRGSQITLFDLVDGGSRRLGAGQPEGRWMLLRFTPEAERLVSLHVRTLTRERDGDWVEELVLTLWDLATGRQSACERMLQTWASDTHRVDHPRALAVSDRHLAWCGEDGTIALHDLETLKPLSRTRTSGATRDVEFSPDGNTLAVVGEGGVRVVDVVHADRG
ncbi:WD40 repeat domain-containing protein [Nocardiopsis sp. HNM0947]|uniref:WD40 repeat domain-containing protein n=1 Tax=Nocardiopsis coralli TaxID=2772213 RepID=A0ABR9P1F9_9ACTN|nr:WD40 repeat domain-containing protein [Nocardiopsis coralli]MBE2997679.1 WD40 repeat domain-containing protein [Nocardiopsis coralli]